jgi:hypothetical protein
MAQIELFWSKNFADLKQVVPFRDPESSSG